LADKSVGLNFTASADVIASAIDRAEIKLPLAPGNSTDAYNLPWHAISIFDELLAELKEADSVWWMAGIVTPTLVAAGSGFHARRTQRTVLLFTSAVR